MVCHCPQSSVHSYEGQLDYGGFKRAMQRRQDLAESPLITSLLKRSFGLANHDFNTAALRSMIRMKSIDFHLKAMSNSLGRTLQRHWDLLAPS